MTIGYLTNNQGRMDYPRYRRAGLPTCSGLVESLIKQFNRRVKGTEKFWNPTGGETILQLRAAYLSEDDRLAKHLKSRPISPFRPYQGYEAEESWVVPTRVRLDVCIRLVDFPPAFGAGAVREALGSISRPILGREPTPAQQRTARQGRTPNVRSSFVVGQLSSPEVVVPGVPSTRDRRVPRLGLELLDMRDQLIQRGPSLQIQAEHLEGP